MNMRSEGFILLCLLLPFGVMVGCSNNVDPVGRHMEPGIGSSYTWVTLTHDDDRATPDRLDSVIYRVAASIGSYQGEKDVTQFNGSNSPLYIVYNENGNLSRYYQGTYFPNDGYLLPPYWAEFPYNESGRHQTTLIDTVDGNRHITYRFKAERQGAEEVELKGKMLAGWRLDYTFTFEIEEDNIVTTIGGRTLYVPSIGWSVWTEETTERRQDGEVTSTLSKRSDLADYVVLKDS